MREFFRGWRRKAGVATLLLACLLMGIWVRSFVVTDGIYCYSKDEFQVESFGGQLIWSRTRDIFTENSEAMTDEIENDDTQSVPSEEASVWNSLSWYSVKYQPLTPDWNRQIEYLTKREFFGAEISVSKQPLAISNHLVIQVEVVRWSVSWLWAVFALTLLSADLILRKPRKKATTNA